ncbi:MAG: hypothetical protein NXY57DRAFT_631812 [Lentinula lateritia]|nr:MAG: hypothetical protein NXY57DRAFT_631812 [Lentinula lateritia]
MKAALSQCVFFPKFRPVNILALAIALVGYSECSGMGVQSQTGLFLLLQANVVGKKKKPPISLTSATLTLISKDAHAQAAASARGKSEPLEL